MKIPPSTAPSKLGNLSKLAGKTKVAASKTDAGSQPIASSRILPAQTQQVLLDFKSQMAQDAPPVYEDIFGTGQQSLTKATSKTPQQTLQETPQQTPPETSQETPQEVAVLPSYEEATRIANQPTLPTRGTTRGATLEADRGATSSPISQPTTKATSHTPQATPSGEEPPQLPSYEEAISQMGGETTGEAKNKASHKTNSQDFLNSLQNQYEKEAIGYVMERFYYHFQKPPEPVFSPTEQKALVAALENYATTAKAVDAVAQKFGRDNAWQGLFKINQESEHGFDGIFAPEPLDRQKLERQITATATDLKQEGINAPPSSKQDWMFFHSFSLRDSNPQITAPSLVPSSQLALQVTEVKMANLPKRMEQIYLSHSRTLRLMDASRRANKITRDAVKVRRLVLG